MNYTVKIGGIEYPVTRLHYERSYEIEAQEFEVELPTLESIATDSFAEIYRDDELVMKGRIEEVLKPVDQRGVKLIGKAFDLKRKLMLLTSAQTEYSNVDPQTIIRDQITYTDMSEGVINQYGEGLYIKAGDEESDVRIDRRRVIKEVAAVIGWEFYVSPSGTVYFKQQCGNDLSSTVTFKRGENILEWTVPYTYTTARQVKRIVVVGAGKGDARAYGVAETDDYQAGDPEKTFNRRNLTDSNACQKLAQSLLADFQNPVEFGEIKVLDFYTGHAFDVFDTVTIVDDAVGVNGTYRIYRIERTWSGSGEETIIGFCNLTKMNTNAEYLLKRGVVLREAHRGVDNESKFEDPFPLSAIKPELVYSLDPTKIDVTKGIGLQTIPRIMLPNVVTVDGGRHMKGNLVIEKVKPTLILKGQKMLSLREDVGRFKILEYVPTVSDWRNAYVKLLAGSLYEAEDHDGTTGSDCLEDTASAGKCRRAASSDPSGILVQVDV